jgi:hypothetical protein
MEQDKAPNGTKIHSRQNRNKLEPENEGHSKQIKGQTAERTGTNFRQERWKLVI